MNSNYNYDWNQHGDQSLHSVHGEIHAGPHSIPAHSDNNFNGNDDSGAFVAAGTAGQQGFDVRSLGLTEQELHATGLFPSSVNVGRQLPLDQYKINYDPNPIVIRKQIPMEMPTYKQQVIVRYLRPPTPPSPGPLIIKEVRDPQPEPAPPLVIRTRAPREKTPPPIVIREAPPTMPHVDRNPQYVTRVVPSNPGQFSQNQNYAAFQQASFNQNPYNSFSGGNFQYGQVQQTVNNHSYGMQPSSWMTEVVSDNGATTTAPPELLDTVYRVFNNHLPRI